MDKARYFEMEYILYFFEKYLFSIVRSESVVGTISPSIAVGKTSMSIIGETIAVVTSVSQSVTVVTSIQNSGVSLSLGFGFSLTFSQEMRSKSVVGTISPSIAVGKTSMGIITSIIGGVVTSVTQSVTVVTSIQNSWVSLSLGFSFSLTFSQEMRS